MKPVLRADSEKIYYPKPSYEAALPPRRITATIVSTKPIIAHLKHIV